MRLRANFYIFWKLWERGTFGYMRDKSSIGTLAARRMFL